MDRSPPGRQAPLTPCRGSSARRLPRDCRPKPPGEREPGEGCAWVRDASRNATVPYYLVAVRSTTVGVGSRRLARPAWTGDAGRLESGMGGSGQDRHGADSEECVAPAVGFEPTTKRLTAARSTTELRRNALRSPSPQRMGTPAMIARGCKPGQRIQRVSSRGSRAAHPTHGPEEEAPTAGQFGLNPCIWLHENARKRGRIVPIVSSWCTTGKPPGSRRPPSDPSRYSR